MNFASADLAGPTNNATVESFNRRPRQEHLNEHWFMSLNDAQVKSEAPRRDYNENRAHSPLEWSTATEFAPVCRGGQATQAPQTAAMRSTAEMANTAKKR